MNILESKKEIKSFKAMDILEKAIEMEDIIHLELGEPDFDTPKPIKDEGIRAINEEKIIYTHSMGMKELRTEIAKYYNEKYGTNICYENIVVTAGTSPALLLAIYVVLEYSHKKEILTSNPGYACYPNFINFLSGKMKNYDLDINNNFKMDINKIKEKITENTAAILINSPSNPTGDVIKEKEYQEIADLGLCVISDEIYQGLVYNGKQYDSILNYTDNAIVLNGFSKLFSMTGWRLGYLIVPDKFLSLTQKLEQNLFISANTISQYAAIKALTSLEVEKEVENMIKEYNNRRIITINELKKHNLKIAANPEGAYYMIIDVREYTDNSLKFAYEILEKAKVAVTPGIDFGSNLEGFIRISYATSTENIIEGIRRIGDYIKGL
ncbi:MAG: pyridoxal phosphate-dependent aminotransferase [Fusobacteria bacterium]|nr:pyridoxal phosphate-dependent aminotransferase [Fusobacteriota bacterium]